MSSESDAAEMLGEAPPHAVAERVVAEASRLAGGPVAAYVIDLDGSCVIRLAGDAAEFPDHINAPLGIGPEVPVESLPALERYLADALGSSTVVPLLVRDRIVGLLVAREPPAHALDDLARQAALALELASAYTDDIHSVRRRKDVQPAAEIQQNLLPPRLARVEGADVAGGVLPGYDVGGDFFDYASNAEGLWLVVADAVGKGNVAAALSSVAVGALRSARRSGSGLEEAARLTHQTVMETGDVGRFLTAVIAIWDPGRERLRWILCGHPTPLVLRADGSIEELDEGRTYPLGLFEEDRDFAVAETHLGRGDRLVLYSDGVSERRTPNGGFFGVDRVREVLSETDGASAAVTARTLQDAVIDASPAPMRDDATLLVVAPR
jgi:serine phosphatase RsbU (regulator of sigma subunit)